MTDQNSEIQPASDFAELTERLDQLRREHDDYRIQAEQRLVLAETRLAAVHAGIIDMDGLQFLDTSMVRLGEDGSVEGVKPALERLKSQKPWLFRSPSTSSTARAPSVHPQRTKHVSEMTDDEYRAARQRIVSHSL